MVDFNTIMINVFDELVTSIRETGVIDSIQEIDNTSVIQSKNKLSEMEVIKVNNKDYDVSNVTPTSFTIKAIGLTEGLSWTSNQPYYEFGHPKEIANILIEKDKQKAPFSYKKYPLVVLFTDIGIYKDDPKIEGKIKKLYLAIINFSNVNYSSKERYDNNIIPILYPIYNKLIKKIKSSQYFIGVNPIVKHTLTEMPFWGSVSKYGNISNMFNDPLDAIQITDMELLINSKKCLT